MTGCMGTGGTGCAIVASAGWVPAGPHWVIVGIAWSHAPYKGMGVTRGAWESWKVTRGS